MGAENIRVRGLVLLVMGAAPLALVALLTPVAMLNGIIAYLGTYVVFALAIPGALALIGLIELTSGVPFLRIAAKWDALRGWQRGVLGLAIAAAFLACWFAGVVLFATPS